MTQQPFGSTLSASTGAQTASTGPQGPSPSSAMNSSASKSSLSVPASSARSNSPASSGVHFLFLHDCWTLASLRVEGSCKDSLADGTFSVEGASWGCQWQDLRADLGQSLGNVYSVSSARFLPAGANTEPEELHRLISPDVDVDPDRFDLTAFGADPCSFVARRRQAVFVDERFQDAPSVSHVPALRLHQALVWADARRVCRIGSVLAQAVSLNLEEPWLPDSQPSSTAGNNEVLTVDFEVLSLPHTI